MQSASARSVKLASSMNRVVSKTIFYTGVLLALAPIYSLGVMIVDIVNAFSMMSTAEAGTTPEISGPIRSAIIAGMMILPGYLAAVILLVPLLKSGYIREARIVRNILIATSLIVLLSVPIGTAVAIVTLIALFMARAKFRA